MKTLDTSETEEQMEVLFILLTAPSPTFPRIFATIISLQRITKKQQQQPIYVSIVYQASQCPYQNWIVIPILFSKVFIKKI